MTTASSSTRIPGCAGARIAAAGKEWDAVRTDRFLGLQAVDRLGAAAGPVIVEPAAVYFLVPPGGTTAWDVPQSKGLGTGHYVVLPAADRNRPPGPYWLLPPERQLAAVDDVRRALEAVAALVLLDHALSRRVELPRRSVIDAGTDALVHHLRRLMSYNYGPQSEGSTGIQMRTLCNVAERNLAAPVRPTPQTNHRVAYVYWNTLATLTAAFRDLYLAHRPTEPGQRT
ncbi:hypothetical protein [Streptomyces anulatus]|uniref:hypothetical protein n=1 Tax=Streptomyces anulatus TaxID=1892 RepID=UPI0032495C3E|nr:hypothetical protein OH791_37585 [Streptomyces anulatus]